METTSDDAMWHVMVSSTMHDLELERLAARRAILDAGMDPWMTEHLPAESASDTPRDFCKTLSENCDIYLLILGPRYGFTPDKLPADSGQSATQLEFGWARGDSLSKLKVFIRVDAEKTEDERQHAFITTALEFDTGHVHFAPFSTPDELYLQVAEALEDWKKTRSIGLERYLRTVRDQHRRYYDRFTKEYVNTDELVELTFEDMGEVDNSAGATSPWAINRTRSHNASNHLASMAVLSKLFDSSERAALLGEPGSGKSVYLYQLAYWLARDALNSEIAARPPIPILLNASRLAAELANGLPLTKAIRHVAIGQSRPEAEFALETALQTGDAVLLVDSLDEIGSLQLRRLVTSALSQLVANNILLTSRSVAFEPEFAKEWRPFQLAELDLSEQRVVASRVLRRLSTHEPQHANRNVESLFREVEQRHHLQEWAENPLLLVMLATQYHRRGSISDQRADLYRFAVLQMIGARPRDIDSRFRDDELVRLLGDLATYMLDSYLDEASDDHLTAWAKLSKRDWSAEDLRAFLEESALLEHAITGNWRFIHFSFQEYLAALALAALAPITRENHMLRKRLDPWWDATTMLLMSELDATVGSRDDLTPRVCPGIMRDLPLVRRARIVQGFVRTARCADARCCN